MHLFQDDDDDNNEYQESREKVDVLICRHVGDDEIEAVVDPETLDLVGPQTEELTLFLQNVNMSIKSLIEMSIFSSFIEAKIFIGKEPEGGKSLPPPNKKVKKEDLEAAAVIKESFWADLAVDGKGFLDEAIKIGHFKVIGNSFWIIFACTLPLPSLCFVQVQSSEKHFKIDHRSFLLKGIGLLNS